MTQKNQIKSDSLRETSFFCKGVVMTCKRIVMLTILYLGMVSSSSAQGFLGFAWRVGVFYTTYKFIDGLSNGLLSRFVESNIDTPLDAVYSFGTGVKRFGVGIRTVAATLVSQRGDSLFSEIWTCLKHEYDQAVFAGQKEWSDRRERALAYQALEEHKAKLFEQEKKQDEKVPRGQLKDKEEQDPAVAERRKKREYGFRYYNNDKAVA